MSNVQSRLESVAQNGYNFRLGDYISKGFNIFGKNAGLFIGYFIIYILIIGVISIIPILGGIARALISGALSAGFFIVADKTADGEYVTFSNFFDGFRDWVQLFVAGLLSGLLVILALIPAIAYLMVTIGLTALMESDAYNNPFTELSGLNMAIFFLLLFAGILVSVLFMYAPMFVYFDRLSAWDAIMASSKVVLKNFFSHIIFLIVWFFIIALSCLPLFLGLLATIPAYSCSVYAAWRDITNYNKEVKDDDELLNHLID